MSRRFDLHDPQARARGIVAAGTSASRGRVVCVPTETVYALLADAFSERGVADVRALKNRPGNAALPVAVSSTAMLGGIAERLWTPAQALVEAFWPGPLTLLCRRQPSLAWAVGGGRTLTVRMPLHPVVLDVVTAVGPSVLIATGSDAAGNPVLESAGDAAATKATRAATVDVYLDAGPRPPGPASTVVDVREARPRLVRAGAVSRERLEAVAGELDDPSQETA